MDIESRTDDEHRALLALLPPDLFDLSDLDVGIARLTAMLGAAPPELPASVSIDDHLVTTDDGHELLVRTYRPAAAASPAPALYWMHGGGLVLGSVTMDDQHCAEVADATGVVVASVEYRLAPAWPYPTPLEDCHVGLRWLFASAETLGLDPARIAIGGGSAGAGLAAALALLVRDGGRDGSDGGPTLRPCFQLLRYPMLDDRNTTPSSRRITDGRVWNRTSNIAGWRAYLGERAGTEDVEVYAAAARATDLAGLPPAIITVGDLDLFLDEDIAFATALLQAGVPTELHVHPGSFHGSDVMVPHAGASQRWRRDELDALRRALGTG